MKSSKGRESNQQLFSIICVYVPLYLSFVVLFFNSKYPDFGNSRRVHQSIKSTRSIIKKMGVVLCKASWNSDWGKSMCCIHVFCLVKWNNNVKEIWSCDLYGFENLRPLYDEERDFSASFWIKFRWPLVRATMKFGKCVCHSKYACFAFCLFVSLFFGDTGTWICANISLMNHYFWIMNINVQKLTQWIIMFEPCILIGAIINWWWFTKPLLIIKPK